MNNRLPILSSIFIDGSLSPGLLYWDIIQLPSLQGGSCEWERKSIEGNRIKLHFTRGIVVFVGEIKDLLTTHEKRK